MPGCRSIKKDEIVKVLSVLKSHRDRTLFIVGIKTGFRISELLSLKVSDVYRNGVVLDRVSVSAKNMKGGVQARSIPLHAETKPYIAELAKNADSDSPLFKSRKGNAAIGRLQALHILQTAFNDARLTGKLATHSMRKTFAEMMYRGLKGNLRGVATALGHANINNTVRYLAIDEEEVWAAILKG